MKVRRPEARPGPRAPAGPTCAREAAIEADRNRFLKLACGHVTYWETDRVYRSPSSPRDKFYCETCGKWILPEKKAREPIPAEPLF